MTQSAHAYIAYEFIVSEMLLMEVTGLMVCLCWEWASLEGPICESLRGREDVTEIQRHLELGTHEDHTKCSISGKEIISGCICC